MSRQKNEKIEEEDSQDPNADDEYACNEDGLLKCTLFQNIQGKKRSWTADEDAYLIKLVQKYGAQKWTSIADHLPGHFWFIQVE